jgi:hypothetical protein
MYSTLSHPGSVALQPTYARVYVAKLWLQSVRKTWSICNTVAREYAHTNKWWLRRRQRQATRDARSSSRRCLVTRTWRELCKALPQIVYLLNAACKSQAGVVYCVVVEDGDEANT